MENLSAPAHAAEPSPLTLPDVPLDLAMSAPDNWLSLKWHNRPFSSKSSEFCILQNDDKQIERYIRCVLPMQLKGTDQEFRFGVWMSVSEESWNIYRQGFKSGVHEKYTCFGLLGNHLPHMGATFGMHADIEFMSDGERPRVHLHEAKHLLYFCQSDGLPIAYLEKLAAKVH